MSLIFDSFETRDAAEAFAASMRSRWGRQVRIYDSDAAAYEDDPRPFDVEPPVVHVDRDADLSDEDEIEALVESYGGSFAGT